MSVPVQQQQQQHRGLAVQHQQQQRISVHGMPVSRCCGNDHVLTISDMQTGFPAAANVNLQRTVKNLIAHARAQGWPILVVVWAGQGDIHEAITSALCGYDLVERVEKHHDNGAAWILEACRRRGFTTNHFVVCGVNTDACVRRTVEGLCASSGSPAVDVIMEACGTMQNPDWFLFPETANVRLLPSLYDI